MLSQITKKKKKKKKKKPFHTDWFDLFSRHGARFSEGHCTFDQTDLFLFFFVMMKVKEKFWMKSQRKLTVAKKSVMQSVISERNL